jgi:glycosyltransferase involved in cell wall biosynthesis
MAHRRGDDGSGDASRTVIDSFGNRISVVFKPNDGQASAIDTGCRHSRGDGVIFVDVHDAFAEFVSSRYPKVLATIACGYSIVNNRAFAGRCMCRVRRERCRAADRENTPARLSLKSSRFHPLGAQW